MTTLRKTKNITNNNHLLFDIVIDNQIVNNHIGIDDIGILKCVSKTTKNLIETLFDKNKDKCFKVTLSQLRLCADVDDNYHKDYLLIKDKYSFYQTLYTADKYYNKVVSENNSQNQKIIADFIMDFIKNIVPNMFQSVENISTSCQYITIFYLYDLFQTNNENTSILIKYVFYSFIQKFIKNNPYSFICDINTSILVNLSKYEIFNNEFLEKNSFYFYTFYRNMLTSALWDKSFYDTLLEKHPYLDIYPIDFVRDYIDLVDSVERVFTGIKLSQSVMPMA
jgi:hypothetical protein